MTRVNLRLLFLTGAAAGSLAASAQTATHHTTAATHHPTARPAAHSECAVVPTLSPQIPAAPAGTPCAKAMITISEDIQFSPLVGPELKTLFPNLPTKFALDYQELMPGSGELARPHMYYTVKYTGYLLDGTKFDASADHAETSKGISFAYGAHRVIPGWDMGFEGMHVGGKRRLFVPYQLAYGERPQRGIPPKSELIFDMELVAQSTMDPNAPPTPPTGSVPTVPVQPGQPSTLPATPPSARPQTGPDVKPAPPTSGAPTTTPQTPPPTAKQPPPTA